MTNEYEVFQPSNERLAQVIAEILNEKGYFASYQLGYPNNKIFIKVNTKEEAHKISQILKNSNQKQYSGTGLPTAKLDELTSKLMETIPQISERKEIEPLSANIAEKQMDNCIPLSPKVEAQASLNLDGLKSLITSRIEFLNAQISKHRRDRANEMRAVEIDTLNWVLRNMQ